MVSSNHSHFIAYCEKSKYLSHFIHDDFVLLPFFISMTILAIENTFFLHVLVETGGGTDIRMAVVHSM